MFASLPSFKDVKSLLGDWEMSLFLNSHTALLIRQTWAEAGCAFVTLDEGCQDVKTVLPLCGPQQWFSGDHIRLPFPG